MYTPKYHCWQIKAFTEGHSTEQTKSLQKCSIVDSAKKKGKEKGEVKEG